MTKLPLWKEAYQLQVEYAKHGIGYCYNQRNHNVYLSIKDAPYVNPTYKGDGCMLTGWIVLYGGVEQSRDITMWVNKVKEWYVDYYAGNIEMLKYAELIN